MKNKIKGEPERRDTKIAKDAESISMASMAPIRQTLRALPIRQLQWHRFARPGERFPSDNFNGTDSPDPASVSLPTTSMAPIRQTRRVLPLACFQQAHLRPRLQPAGTGARPIPPVCFSTLLAAGFSQCSSGRKNRKKTQKHRTGERSGEALILCRLQSPRAENPRSLRRFGLIVVRMKRREKRNAARPRSQRMRGGIPIA